MAKSKTILVVGASYGGLHAAASARRRDDDARICVIDEAVTSKKISSREEIFCKRNGLELVRAHAVKLDPDARGLSLVAPGMNERVPYDVLIYAGASVECRLSIPGFDPANVVSFFDIRDHLENNAPRLRNAVIVGCSINAIESAIMLTREGFHVTLVEKRRRSLPEFSLAFSHAILEKLRSEGINVLLGDYLVAAHHDSSGEISLTTHHGVTLSAGLIVSATGLTPQFSLLADAGAALDIDGFVRVDDHLATTLPHVFACGNAVKTPVILTNERKWLFSKSCFQQSALVAGNNAASADGTYDVVSSSCQTMTITTTGCCFARTGLTDEEARIHLGDDNLVISTVYEQEFTEGTSNPHHCVRLLLDRTSRAIVGGEIFGESNVCGRISILSQAVRERYTPERLLNIDMMLSHDHDELLLDPLKEAALRAQFHFVNHAPIMSAETLALWLKSNRDFRLVDVSDAPAFSGRKAKQMIHLPLERLREGAPFEAPDLPVVIFSNCGEQSQRAQRALMHRGHTNVYNLDGGLATFAMLFAKEHQ